jgi:DNA-binding transcriptional MerR regulator
MFSTNEVSRCSGLSLRQLQWWHENGVLVPSIGGGEQGRHYRGADRRYSRRELQLAYVAGALRRKRYPWSKVKGVIRFLEQERYAAVFDVASAESPVYLLVTDKKAWIETNEDDVILRIAIEHGAVWLVKIV